jgi:hypothetical protein
MNNGFTFSKGETFPFFNLTPGPSPNWRGVTNAHGSCTSKIVQNSTLFVVLS